MSFYTSFKVDPNSATTPANGYVTLMTNLDGDLVLKNDSGTLKTYRAPEDVFNSSFVSVEKNLNGLPFTLNWSGDVLTSVVYTLPNSSTITKTLNYTGELLTSVVLSGATPSGIDLTKTLTYLGDTLTGVSYS